MLKLSEKAQNTFAQGLEMTFGQGRAPAQSSYILAANNHVGISDRFGLSASLPTPEVANAPTLQFANFG
jgi:hypothetical protein